MIEQIAFIFLREQKGAHVMYSFLDRRIQATSYSNLSALSERQVLNDKLLNGFVSEAANPYMLAGMFAGTFTYQFLKPGLASFAVKLLGPSSSSLWSSLFVKGFSTSLAFGAEICAFEGTQRSLMVKWGGADSSLLKWSGENGIKKGLWHSAFSFGALKGAGAMTHGRNIVLQHSVADFSMLAAHHLQSSFDSSVNPSQGTWLDEIAAAEVMQFQMMLSASLISPNRHLSSKALENSIVFDSGFNTQRAVSNLNSGEQQTLVFASNDRRKPGGLPPPNPPPTRRLAHDEPPTQQRPLPPRRPNNPTDLTLRSAAAAGPKAPPPVFPQVVIEVPQNPGDEPVSSDGLTMIGKAPQLTPGQALPISAGDSPRREVLAETPKVVIFGTVDPSSSGRSMIGKAPSVNTLGVFYEGQTLLDRFTIKRRMGLEAGMSEVYEGWEESLSRRVVIKILKPELNSNKITLQRFKREGIIQSRVASPHITSVYVNGEIEGTHFIVLEYLEGETLNKVMERNQEGYPQSAVIEIALQIAKALRSIHEKGVVHRDLKPDNIFLLEDGFVKLIDFGIAKMKGNTDPFIEESQRSPLNRGRLTEVGGLPFGTPHYMSPEQVRSEDVESQSDIYSLGVMLYELATGKYPYEGVGTSNVAHTVMLAHLNQSPISFKEIGVSNLSPAFEKFLKKCMAKNVSDRFQNADEVIAALNNLKKESDRVARESTIIPPPPFISKRPVYLGVGAVGIILAGALGIGFFAGRKKDQIFGPDVMAPDPSAPNTLPSAVDQTVTNPPANVRYILLDVTQPGVDFYQVDDRGSEKSIGRGSQIKITLPEGQSIHVRVRKSGFKVKDVTINNSAQIDLEPLEVAKVLPSASTQHSKPLPSQGVRVNPVPTSIPTSKPTTTGSGGEMKNPFEKHD